MKTEEEISRFKQLLDDQYEWPSDYSFKFVVPTIKEEEVVVKCFSQDKIEKKFSSSGKYVSLTAKRSVSSSDEVLEVYQAASTIEGIISL